MCVQTSPLRVEERRPFVQVVFASTCISHNEMHIYMLDSQMHILNTFLVFHGGVVSNATSRILLESSAKSQA